MKTTLNKIRANSPCESGWKKLLANLGKTKADDEPLAITTILDSNGLDDALWCLRAVDGYQREMRLYAVDCARSVQHLMTDARSLNVLDVAERHADGLATDEELAASYAASYADDAAYYAAASAASYAASYADDAAASAAYYAAAAYAASYAASAAYYAAAAAASAAYAKTVQADLLRIVCAEIEQREEM